MMSNIRLSHGSGGRATSELLQDVIFPILGPSAGHGLDAALMDLSLADRQKIAITTDGFVIQPIEFPGGDIGKLAVCGTLNDLAVVGACPVAVALGMILEEGLPLEVLERILRSIALEAEQNGVHVVTGDTKVVRKGEADRIFLTTTGIGVQSRAWNLHPQRIVEEDRILVSGTIGEHGAAILAARESFGLEGALVSDCACLWPLIERLERFADSIRFMRDPTRGGLAAVLHEAFDGTALGAEIYESQLPIRKEVSAFSEVLGIEPLYLASEGRVLLVTDRAASQSILEEIKQSPLGRDAAEIGTVTAAQAERIVLKNPYGSGRFLMNPAEEQLPRIC
jgi:hydrogenase expression/formation protein HypE